MGQYLNVNGDYNIKTAEGSSIVLDTGPGIGNTRVTGNLVVEGGTFNVSAQNLNIKDNIIILNDGELGTIYEPGGGVTLRYSGIQIDRGPSVDLPPPSLFFDEFDDTWNIAFGTPGAYNFANSKLRLRRILTDPLVDAGALTLIGTGTGVVNVFGTANYEDQVVADDDIPNKKYVDDAIQNNPTFQILADRTGTTTRVIIADKELDDIPPDPSIPGSVAYFENETGLLSFGESSASIIVDDSLVSQFFSNRAVIQGLEFRNNEIANDNSSTNIIVRTNGTGKLETNYAIQVNQIGIDPNISPNAPLPVTDATLIYAAEPSVGTTGLFVVNSVTDDELINKNKALVFSMLF